MTLVRFILLSQLALASCLADGGAVIARQSLNGLDFTVFASPAPLRAGPLDVSVLMQDEKTGRPVLDAAVTVSWSAVSSSSPEWMPPCCTMASPTDAITATRGHSQNKFLYSAIVPVRSAGPSEIVIRAQALGREAVITCDIDAAPPRPPAMAYWPFLALPPVAVAGFALHQRLAQKK